MFAAEAQPELSRVLSARWLALNSSCSVLSLASCFPKHLGAACARLAAPPVVFFASGSARAKVWPEQLVALATLCATAAYWNRNWPIHISLQARSGPCLVLADYLISIQTTRVSAPLLRSLVKRAQPASLWKPPEPSSLLPFPVLITHSFVSVFSSSLLLSWLHFFSWSLVSSLFLCPSFR